MINKLTEKKAKKSIDLLQNDFFQIDSAVSAYYETEENESTKFYEILESNGALIESFLSPLINNYDVKTTNLLLELANLLGRWIYLIDAYDDLEDDIKNNNFNPILLIDNLDDVKIVVQSIETKISEIIKSLPLRCYQNLIEYIFIYNLSDKSKNI